MVPGRSARGDRFVLPLEPAIGVPDVGHPYLDDLQPLYAVAEIVNHS